MARWALIAVAVVVAGCASSVVPSPAQTLDSSATPASPPISSPTTTPTATPTASAAGVVFRMSVGGGLRYPGATLEEAPAFSLYEDGRVIYQRPIQTPPEQTSRYELWQAQLTDEQMVALLEYAVDEAGLATTPNLPAADVPVADAGTTTFEIHAADVDRVISVYYVDYDDAADPNRDARRRLARLASELATFGERVDSGEVADLGRFEPERYLVTLDQPFGPDSLWSPVEWPWPDLEPDDFAIDQAGLRQAVLDAAHVRQVADPIVSVPDGYVVAGPNDRDYLVRIRPLLPDEIP